MGPASIAQVLVSPHVGGAEKVALAIHRALMAEQRWAPRLLVPAGGSTEEAVADERLPRSLFGLRRLLSPNAAKSALGNLELLCGFGMSPDILHFHAPFVFGAAALARRATRARTVLHIHQTVERNSLSWPLQHPPDLILACAQTTVPTIESAVEDLAPPRRPRIRVIQNAVDVGLFYPEDKAAARATLGLDPTTPVALLVGNLAKTKGQHTAIRALAFAKSAGHQLHLLLVGEEREAGAAYTSSLHELARALRVDESVTFLGFRNDVPALLRAADFLLLPSATEAFPLVVLEAHASKTVVLASSVGDVPLIIRDGETGFLIPSEDPEGYAAVIGNLINRPDLMQAVAQRGFAQVHERYKLERYCEEVIQEYGALLELGRR